MNVQSLTINKLNGSKTDNKRHRNTRHNDIQLIDNQDKGNICDIQHTGIQHNNTLSLC